MKGFQACVGESVEAIGTSSAPSIFSSFGDLTGDTKGVKRVLSPGTPELFWDFGLLTRSWDFKPRICVSLKLVCGKTSELRFLGVFEVTIAMFACDAPNSANLTLHLCWLAECNADAASTALQERLQECALVQALSHPITTCRADPLIAIATSTLYTFFQHALHLISKLPFWTSTNLG
ncbi:hypothetical protein TWF751_002332 [Orbilia oligospora]|nr:hypothetical protein TWF751_002332 [Orbilia oligospora]